MERNSACKGTAKTVKIIKGIGDNKTWQLV
jgi:hypothetical protein